jgi:hypothetical protein
MTRLIKIILLATVVLLSTACANLSSKRSVLNQSPGVHTSATYTMTRESNDVPIEFHLHAKFLKVQNESRMTDLGSVVEVTHTVKNTITTKTKVITASDVNELADEYYNVGYELIVTMCGRWFDDLDGEYRKNSYNNDQFNIFKDFGTILLGIGKANPNWSTFYGGSTGAYNAMTQSYRDTYLMSGSIGKVKQKTMDLLDDFSKKIKPDVKDFSSAYKSLEMTGAMCSPATAKLILEGGLEIAVVEASKSGAISVTGDPRLGAAKQAAVASQFLGNANKALTAETSNAVKSSQTISSLNDQISNTMKSIADLTASMTVSSKTAIQTGDDKNELDRLNADLTAFERGLSDQKNKFAKLQRSLSKLSLAVTEAKSAEDAANKVLSKLAQQ